MWPTRAKGFIAVIKSILWSNPDSRALLGASYMGSLELPYAKFVLCVKRPSFVQDLGHYPKLYRSLHLSRNRSIMIFNFPQPKNNLICVGIPFRAHLSKHHCCTEVWSPCLRLLVPAAIDSGAPVVVQAWRNMAPVAPGCSMVLVYLQNWILADFLGCWYIFYIFHTCSIWDC